jgi:DNA polymerase III sliding clamp (beta) subunit (PCNA family)
VPEESVSFSFKDPHSAAEVQPAGGSENYRYRYVVMPMRI